MLTFAFPVPALASYSRFTVKKTYTTRKTDTLSWLGEILYSNSEGWKKLKADNPALKKFKASQKLGAGKKIRYSAPAIGTLYTIQHKDCLSKISRWKFGNERCLGSITQTDGSTPPEILTPGAILKIDKICRLEAKHKTAAHTPTHLKSPADSGDKKEDVPEPPAAPPTAPEPETEQASVSKPKHESEFKHTVEPDRSETESKTDTSVKISESHSENLPGEFSLGLGFTDVIYGQSGSNLTTFNLNELGPSLRITGSHAFQNSQWRLNYSGLAVFPLLLSSVTGSSLYTVAIDAGIAHDIKISDSWYFRPVLGANYLTAFSVTNTTTNFGYDDLAGPQITLGLIKSSNHQKSLGIQLKYTQILNMESISKSLSSRNIQLNMDYHFSKFGISLDFGWASFGISPDNTIDSKTFGLGVIYGF